MKSFFTSALLLKFFSQVFSGGLPIYFQNSGQNSEESSNQGSPGFLVNEANALLAKYPELSVGSEAGTEDGASNSNGRILKVDPSSTSLVNRVNMQYYSIVDIGTPPQTFHLQLDTGSASLWVATYNSSLEESLKNTDVGGSLFYPNNSTTFTATNNGYHLPYADSSFASGLVAYDTVRVGSYSVPRQQFGAMTVTSEDMYEGSASGIMGMSFAALDRTTPFWQAANIKLFSIGLSAFRGDPDSATVREQPGGVFTLGGIDDSLYTGKIQYLPLTSTSHWQVAIDGLKFNGQEISNSQSSRVMIDSGTSLLAIPARFVKAIYSQIPGAVAGTGAFEGYHYFPCNFTAQLSLVFGGVEYTISSDDFIAQRRSSDTSLCYGSVFSTGSINAAVGTETWIIGAAFLRNVYAVFRAEAPAAVGFAQPAKNFGDQIQKFKWDNHAVSYFQKDSGGRPFRLLKPLLWISLTLTSFLMLS